MICILIIWIKNYVIVRVANIKNFMRSIYEIFIDKIRMFTKKIVWFCMAIKSTNDNKSGEKKCTKK